MFIFHAKGVVFKNDELQTSLPVQATYDYASNSLNLLIETERNSPTRSGFYNKTGPKVKLDLEKPPEQQEKQIAKFLISNEQFLSFAKSVIAVNDAGSLEDISNQLASYLYAHSNNRKNSVSTQEQGIYLMQGLCVYFMALKGTDEQIINKFIKNPEQRREIFDKEFGQGTYDKAGILATQGSLLMQALSNPSSIREMTSHYSQYNPQIQVFIDFLDSWQKHGQDKEFASFLERHKSEFFTSV